jgi:steroid delta-isomerase-like uncharacterized protein
MSAENKAIIRHMLTEVLSGGKLALLDKLLSPDYVDHNPFPGLPPTREGIKQTVAMLREAFPDLQIIIEDLIAEGDKVVSRQTLLGTHKSQFMGIPPTGKRVTWTQILIFRIADNKIVEEWSERDQMGMMQQLGVVPAPGG